MVKWSVVSKRYGRFPTVDPTGIKRVPLGHGTLTLGSLCLLWDFRQLISNQFCCWFLGRVTVWVRKREREKRAERSERTNWRKWQCHGQDHYTCLLSALPCILAHKNNEIVFSYYTKLIVISQRCFFIWESNLQDIQIQEMLERI